MRSPTFEDLRYHSEKRHNIALGDDPNSNKASASYSLPPAPELIYNNPTYNIVASSNEYSTPPPPAHASATTTIALKDYTLPPAPASNKYSF